MHRRDCGPASPETGGANQTTRPALAILERSRAASQSCETTCTTTASPATGGDAQTTRPPSPRLLAERRGVRPPQRCKSRHLRSVGGGGGGAMPRDGSPMWSQTSSPPGASGASSPGETPPASSPTYEPAEPGPSLTTEEEAQLNALLRKLGASMRLPPPALPELGQAFAPGWQAAGTASSGPGPSASSGPNPCACAAADGLTSASAAAPPPGDITGHTPPPDTGNVYKQKNTTVISVPGPSAHSGPSPCAIVAGGLTSATAPPGGTGGRHTPPPRRASPAGGQAIRQDGDVRHYVVWHIPDSNLVGVVTGQFPAVWRHICQHLPGGQYPGSGAHLRRMDTLLDAITAYRAEHRLWCIDLPDDPPIHRI